MAKLAAVLLLLTLQLCCDASNHSYPPAPPSLISSERCRPDESTALLQFKNSFVNHDDDKMATWKEGSECCSWEGVTCDRFSSHVVGLHLGCDQVQPSYTPCRRFKGTDLHPNSSLFHLRHLRSLDLSYNDFNGSTIPSTFTQLTSLAHLNLSRSGFSGNIPLGFSQLNKLVTLDLSYNWPDGDLERALSFGDNDDFSKLMLNATGLSKLLLGGVNEPF